SAPHHLFYKLRLEISLSTRPLLNTIIHKINRLLKIFYIGIMKKKPLLITILCLVVAFVCIFFFVKARYFRKKADTNEIAQFVKAFDADFRSGNIDSLRNYFAARKNPKV